MRDPEGIGGYVYDGSMLSSHRSHGVLARYWLLTCSKSQRYGALVSSWWCSVRCTKGVTGGTGDGNIGHVRGGFMETGLHGGVSSKNWHGGWVGADWHRLGKKGCTIC